MRLPVCWSSEVCCVESCEEADWESAARLEALREYLLTEGDISRACFKGRKRIEEARHILRDAAGGLRWECRRSR